MRQRGDNLSVGLVGRTVAVIVTIGLGSLVAGAWLLDWVSVDRPIADGPYLGLTYVDYNPRVVRQCRCRPGALVTAVDPGSPADAAGIRAGDVIAVFAGQPLDDDQFLLPLILACRPGERVALEVWRTGHVRQVEIVLGQRNQQ